MKYIISSQLIEEQDSSGANNKVEKQIGKLGNQIIGCWNSDSSTVTYGTVKLPVLNRRKRMEIRIQNCNNTVERNWNQGKKISLVKIQHQNWSILCRYFPFPAECISNMKPYSPFFLWHTLEQHKERKRERGGGLNSNTMTQENKRKWNKVEENLGELSDANLLSWRC